MLHIIRCIICIESDPFLLEAGVSVECSQRGLMGSGADGAVSTGLFCLIVDVFSLFYQP